MDFAPPSPSKTKFRHSEEFILEEFFQNHGKGDKNISLMNTTTPSKPGNSGNAFKKL
jgi:hypothetical protein